ncbi:class I SAM-dependent methyltransferase [bacterium]|nr:class I SAM-dependent methyltransferase [bacterium]
MGFEIEPVNDKDYWSDRLNKYPRLHQAVFLCHEHHWDRLQVIHKDILHDVLGDSDSVLDVGCAWGRLLDLFPKTWSGEYLGIDVCPDFIDIAKREHPDQSFLAGDLLDIQLPLRKDGLLFDYGIVSSVKHMVIRNMGESVWDSMENIVRSQCKCLLFLEYDLNDGGFILQEC